MKDVGKHLRNQWMGALALFLVLTGGTAWAATSLTKNSVRSFHIVNGQVKTPDLKRFAVKAGKLAPNAVRTPHIRDGAVSEAKLASELQMRISSLEDRATALESSDSQQTCEDAGGTFEEGGNFAGKPLHWTCQDFELTQQDIDAVENACWSDGGDAEPGPASPGRLTTHCVVE